MAMLLHAKRYLGRSTCLAPLRQMNTIIKVYNDNKGLLAPKGCKNNFLPSTNGKKRTYSVTVTGAVGVYGGVKGLETIGKYFIKEAFKKKLSWQRTLDGKLYIQVDVWRFDKPNLKIEVENQNLLITAKNIDLLGEEVKLEEKIPLKENVDEESGIAEYRYGLVNVIFPIDKSEESVVTKGRFEVRWS